MKVVGGREWNAEQARRENGYLYENETPMVPERVARQMALDRIRYAARLRRQSRPWPRFVRWQRALRWSIRWAVGSLFVRFGEWVRG